MDDHLNGVACLKSFGVRYQIVMFHWDRWHLKFDEMFGTQTLQHDTLGDQCNTKTVLSDKLKHP